MTIDIEGHPLDVMRSEQFPGSGGSGNEIFRKGPRQLPWVKEALGHYVKQAAQKFYTTSALVP